MNNFGTRLRQDLDLDKIITEIRLELWDKIETRRQHD